MLLAHAGRLLPWHSAESWEHGLREALGEARVVLDVHRGGATTHWLLQRSGYAVARVERAHDPYTLPAADDSFDAIFVCRLASQLARPHHALSEWLRVLRPGGRLALMEPRPPQRRTGWLARWRRRRRRRTGPFGGRLSPREAAMLLELADLRRVRVHEPDAPFYLASGRKP
jgi:SAM-dependent methyltransferase